MRMITPIYLRSNRRPTPILIRTHMISTTIPMFSLPLKESTFQEKRWLKKTQCDHRHRMDLGKVSAQQPVIDQSKILNKLILVFDHQTDLEFSLLIKLAEYIWTKWSDLKSHHSMMLELITTKSSGEFTFRMKT